MSTDRCPLMASSEDSPLLSKSAESPSIAHYSQRTVATISTSGSGSKGSYEHLDQLSQSPQPAAFPLETVAAATTTDHEDHQAFLGSVVIFETTHSYHDDESVVTSQVKRSGPQHQSSPNDEPMDGSLVENVMEEVHQVAESVLEELHDADEGHLHYLEMGLTRNLSMLPGDAVDVAAAYLSPPPRLPTDDPDADADLEACDVHKKTPAVDAAAEPPLSAYFLLLSAVVSLSSIGPLLQLQSGTTPTMKIVWRMSGTALLLIPMAASDIYRYGGLPDLTTPQWVTFLLSTASYNVFSLAFVLALEFTAVGNVVILSNSVALILLIGKLCVGDTVTLLEGTGAMIAFGGAALCSSDSSGSHGDRSNALWGDALAILSALGGVGYLIFAKTVRQHIPMGLFMFLTMAVGSGMILIFQTLILAEDVTWNRHPSHGVWGFLVVDQPDRLPLELVMVVVCNLFGTMGYVRAMQYFDNLVLSSAALLEPVVADFLACFLGVGHLPSFQGWLGNALVALGTFAVIYKDGTASSSDGDKGLH